MYRQETPATEEEAAQLQEQARTDPEVARTLLQTIYSLSVEETHTAILLKLFLEGMLMRLVEERAATDDAFALECGTLLVDLMNAMKRPPRGRPRGKARPAKSA